MENEVRVSFAALDKGEDPHFVDTPRSVGCMTSFDAMFRMQRSMVGGAERAALGAALLGERKGGQLMSTRVSEEDQNARFNAAFKFSSTTTKIAGPTFTGAGTLTPRALSPTNLIVRRPATGDLLRTSRSATSTHPISS